MISRMRVMVVDEQESFREMVSGLMAEQGFDVYPAADGIDALRQIYHVMPQLIVSDARLANLSGFEFLPFVKRRFPAIAVIALDAQPGEPAQPSKLGADVLLAKEPWDPDTLLDSIDELLARETVSAEAEDADCA